MVKKEALRKEALQAGFVRVRFLAPFEPAGAAPFEPAGASAHYRQGAPALLVAALPYGNQLPSLPAEGAPPALAGALSIAPFAQRNYYREAVKRLQKLAVRFREQYGRENPSYGLKRNYRIFCNSPVPEKPLGLASGLGALGRNGLLITPEAGSLVIIAALTLPFPLERDGPLEACVNTNIPTGRYRESPCLEKDRVGKRRFPFCEDCVREQLPPCMAACPTGALRGDGSMDLVRCIQWYASGHGEEVPPEVKVKWGKRLYGCTACQDACIQNRRPIPGVETSEGPLPAWVNGEELLQLSDDELKARFRGTAMGLAWLGPEAIRRNIRIGDSPITISSGLLNERRR